MQASQIHQRRAARRLAMQAIYAWQFTQDNAGSVMDSFKQTPEYERADQDYFRALVSGVIKDIDDLQRLIEPRLDRPADQIDPVERSVMLVATHELKTRPEIPYKVVVSEAVALAKKFGAQDGHHYVNAILDKLTRELRRLEVRSVE